jgi:hypothetical protein
MIDPSTIPPGTTLEDWDLSAWVRRAEIGRGLCTCDEHVKHIANAVAADPEKVAQLILFELGLL